MFVQCSKCLLKYPAFNIGIPVGVSCNSHVRGNRIFSLPGSKYDGQVFAFLSLPPWSILCDNCIESLMKDDEYTLTLHSRC